MWLKHRAWIPVAWVIAVGNLVAVGPAAAAAEPLHASIHAVLAGLFALGAGRLMARRSFRPDDERLKHAFAEMHDRLLELEERVDFAERMLAKQRDAERLGPDPR